MSDFHSFESGGGRFFDRNIWPDFRVFRIQRQPFLKRRIGVRLDRVDRAFRLADPAIDAFVRVDDEHVFALAIAVHGANLHAIHQLALDAALVDDVGQLTSFQQIAVVNSFTVSVLAVLALWLKMDAEETSVCRLDRNAEH